MKGRPLLSAELYNWKNSIDVLERIVEYLIGLSVHCIHGASANNAILLKMIKV